MSNIFDHDSNDSNNDSSENESEDNQDPKKSSEFARMLEDSFKKTRQNVKAGDKIKAEILSIGKDEVFVSTGTMHDGTVQRRELLDGEGKLTCKVGDWIDLFVIHAKGSDIFLSPKPTSKNIADTLEDAFDMMLPIEGKVTEICKGGFRVSIHGKSAFCPISQMDLKRIETGEEYVGQKLEFLITQFSEGGRNIVVSRRRLLEDQKGLFMSEFAETHKSGEIMNGKITRLEKFGAFVELFPGIEGLIHISELGWSRINDPHEVVQVGQQVQVKLLRTEEKEGHLKISLSLKQVEPDPWGMVPQKFPVGSLVKGRVERREPYGLFVRLDERVVGLLPKSKAIEDSQFHYEKIKIGDEVTVQIGEINLADKKISLSAPQDPGRDDWRGFAPSSTGSFGTLGDQMKNALGKSKLKKS